MTREQISWLILPELWSHEFPGAKYVRRANVLSVTLDIVIGVKERQASVKKQDAKSAIAEHIPKTPQSQ